MIRKGVKTQMKIVAGLGSIDEYIPYVKAGADEFFCGSGIWKGKSRAITGTI